MEIPVTGPCTGIPDRGLEAGRGLFFDTAGFLTIILIACPPIAINKHLCGIFSTEASFTVPVMISSAVGF
jgi:hypothetical protein